MNNNLKNNKQYFHIVDGEIRKIDITHPLEGVYNKCENAEFFLKDLNISINDLKIIGSNNNLFKTKYKDREFTFYIESNDGGGKNIFNENKSNKPSIKCSIPYDKKYFKEAIISLDNVLVISQYFPLISKNVNKNKIDYEIDYKNCVYSIIEPKEIYHSKGFKDILSNKKANSSNRWVSLDLFKKIIKNPYEFYKNKKKNVYLVHCSNISNFFENSKILDQEMIIINEIKNYLSKKIINSNEKETNFFNNFNNYTKENNRFKSINEYFSQIMKFDIPRNLFRKSMLNKSNKCEILNCNIDIKETLIASHIKAVNEIINDTKIKDKEKIDQIFDENNGFIFCKNHDSLFDKHLISFTNDGRLIVKKVLEDKVKQLGIEKNLKVLDYISDKTKNYLDWHRNLFNKNKEKLD